MKITAFNPQRKRQTPREDFLGMSRSWRYKSFTTGTQSHREAKGDRWKKLEAFLRHCQPGSDQAVIKAHILVDHAFGGEAFARALIGTGCVAAA